MALQEERIERKPSPVVNRIKQKTDAVNSEVIFDAEPWNPGVFLDKLKAFQVWIESERQGNRHQKPDGAHNIGKPTDQVFFLFIKEQEQ